MPNHSGHFAGRPILCMVTAGHAVSSGDLVPSITSAARAGVDLIHIRERHLPARDLLSLVIASLQAAADTAARVIVNDRLDIALAAGAHGVHLRGDSCPPPAVRRLTPDKFIVGRSVQSLEEAAAVDDEGACDYLVFGTVFASATKPIDHRPAGLDALRAVCERVRVPVLAIGGVTAANAASLRAAGASGLAGIGIFAEPADLARTVSLLRTGFDR
jgi:thiamine-phosphate diphosphorylase